MQENIKNTPPPFYEPFPKQKRFHESTALNRLFGGAAGPGKSHALRMEIVRLCLEVPKLKAGVFRRTYPELYASIILPLLEALPTSVYSYNESKKIMTFHATGSTIHFWFIQYDKDVFKYQGEEFDLIAIDELTLFNEFQYSFLKSRLRTTKAYWRACFIATTNPGNIGHAWVKRIWIDGDLTEAEKKETYEYIPAVVYDNPIWAQTDPWYIHRLESLPEDQKKAMLYGDWDTFQGQYFKEWRRDIHVREPVALPREWRRIIALDYGYTAPSAVLWIAIDEDGNVWVYRELYVYEHTYEKLLAQIRAYTSPAEDIFAMVADPALRARSADTGVSFFDVAKSYNFNIIPWVNDRVPGWNILREYLEVAGGPFGPAARLRIFSTCSNLIRTLPQMIYDTTNIEDLNTKGEDHAPDALRYGLMFLSRGSSSLSDVSRLNKPAPRPERSSGGFYNAPIISTHF